jgi:hypothetical protein
MDQNFLGTGFIFSKAKQQYRPCPPVYMRFKADMEVYSMPISHHAAACSANLRQPIKPCNAPAQAQGHGVYCFECVLLFSIPAGTRTLPCCDGAGTLAVEWCWLKEYRTAANLLGHTVCRLDPIPPPSRISPNIFF